MNTPMERKKHDMINMTLAAFLHIHSQSPHPLAIGTRASMVDMCSTESNNPKGVLRLLRSYILNVFENNTVLTAVTSDRLLACSYPLLHLLPKCWIENGLERSEFQWQCSRIDDFGLLFFHGDQGLHVVQPRSLQLWHFGSGWLLSNRFPKVPRANVIEEY